MTLPMWIVIVGGLMLVVRMVLHPPRPRVRHCRRRNRRWLKKMRQQRALELRDSRVAPWRPEVGSATPPRA
ncbi:MAG: hypothetical protein WBA97_35000, partial [Actinophytocola sp.]|uniref:hypothetical protein n=1 Tax=Actinophytocola sp. TaxID=1872138 RepID=UPI003C7787E4